MQFHSQLLSDPEKESIHAEALRILWEAGVKFTATRP